MIRYSHSLLTILKNAIMRAGKVGITGALPGAALMMLINLALLDAPTDNPVANSVNARNNEPMAERLFGND